MTYFGEVVGIVGAATVFGASIGALLVSLTLGIWDSFTPFVLFSAIVTLIGAVSLLLLGRWKSEPRNHAILQISQLGATL